MQKQLELYNKNKEKYAKKILGSCNEDLINRFKIAQTNFEIYYNLLWPHINNITEFTRLCEIYQNDYNKAKQEYLVLFKKVEIKTRTQAVETKTYIESLNNEEILKLAVKPVENTNNSFSYGIYGDFTVIIMNKNGYINSKSIINEALEHENKIQKHKGLDPILRKDFNNWRKNMVTNELYQTISKDIDITIDGLEEVVQGKLYGTYSLQGTYIHPDLVNSLAMWVSPTYALQINRLINNINIKKAEQKLNDLIRVKDDKIDELTKKIDMQIKKIDEQTKKIDNLKVDMQKLLSYGRDAKNTINTIHSNLTGLYKKSVEPIKQEDATILILFDNQIGNGNSIVRNTAKFQTSENTEIEITTDLYPFTFIRRQIKTIDKSIDIHMKKYPYAKEIIRCNIANAALSLNNIKNDLNRKIKGKYNNFILKNDYKKDQFIIDIISILNSGTTELKTISGLTEKYDY